MAIQRKTQQHGDRKRRKTPGKSDTCSDHWFMFSDFKIGQAGVHTSNATRGDSQTKFINAEMEQMGKMS